MQSISAMIQKYCGSQRPTGLVVIREGQIAGTWGSTDHPVNVRSVRKSLLSALYGIAVGEGKINIDDTLEKLAIDDTPPSLSETEKQATVRDLLTCSSGIYHAAAYETRLMGEKRPDRGSHVAGKFWYYNNWDFNALGTIYRQATSQDIFEDFHHKIADPIGMTNYSYRNGVYQKEETSDHPAYLFKMSADDLAKFGLLYLNNGNVNGQQIIPSSWVMESTQPHLLTDAEGFGYGYMWWVSTSDTVNGKGAFVAAGNGGQILAVAPSKQLVIAQTVDLSSNKGRLETAPFFAFTRQVFGHYT
ncbi:class C beta-lactamase-related serine hydrolase [Bosea caraganae]|uniref:Class C beta-lactamase-related serine hydrolase n=1 Tax=Bosea caraganae TaxID=2763117 RepID=A0A370LCK9_9HYPH|nr:serine hydrolase [Bosea caraganae]RDJ27691.1 class C beta-lactamase-related serine hydrolase [Bosea caraganae]RDJ29704.1 class C beta-lactamase-related serine hydrolase [Bosea caraganae]